MSNGNIKTGLVGFFDILGYRNLLERNEPEAIAETVLPILTNIGKDVNDSALDMLSEVFDVGAVKGVGDAETSDKTDNLIDWLVFSDTVLLTTPIEETDPVDVQFRWMSFLTTAIVLQVKLFRAGLPARGAVDYGKFLVKDTCFAGRTIVNTYQLCSQIELAACVFCEGAAAQFRSISTEQKSLYNALVVEYLVPMKGCEKHLLTLQARSYNVANLDVHRDVMRAFWGNKKDISLSARQKAQNTEQWLDFLKQMSDTK